MTNKIDTGAYIHTTSKSAQFWFSAHVFVFNVTIKMYEALNLNMQPTTLPKNKGSNMVFHNYVV